MQHNVEGIDPPLQYVYHEGASHYNYEYITAYSENESVDMTS